MAVHDLIRHRDAWGDEPLIDAPTARDRYVLAVDRHGIRRAAACIAVSEHTRRELVDLLGIPPERVAVVHEGVDLERFRPVEGAPADPYVLFVGSEHPRKDVPALIRAVAELRREPRLRGVRLIKVGAPGHPPERYRPATLRAACDAGREVGRDLVFTGRVPDDALPRWYSGAAALVSPPLEAMACGTPVIVARTGALPEVVGDAGLLVPPRDAEAIARRLREVMLNPRLADELRERACAAPPASPGRARSERRERCSSGSAAKVAQRCGDQRRRIRRQGSPRHDLRDRLAERVKGRIALLVAAVAHPTSPPEGRWQIRRRGVSETSACRRLGCRLRAQRGNMPRPCRGYLACAGGRERSRTPADGRRRMP